MQRQIRLEDLDVVVLPEQVLGAGEYDPGGGQDPVGVPRTTWSTSTPVTSQAQPAT